MQDVNKRGKLFECQGYMGTLWAHFYKSKTTQKVKSIN